MHAVFVSLSFDYVCIHLCRLINLQLANPSNKLKKSMQHVAIAVNTQNIYKHLAMPNIDITQFTHQLLK